VARALILGGGFGGVAAAHRLRTLLGSGDEVLVVDRSDHFMMGFRKNAELAGQAPMDDGRRPLAALEDAGIRFVRGALEHLDPGSRRAVVDGRELSADAVVVALGVEVRPEAVPGLAEHGLNAYDPEEVPRAAELLAALPEGRVALGIFGAPYRCPPAPFELALLIQEAAAGRGASLDLTVFSPQPMSLPVLGPEGCSVIEGRLALRGIRFRPNAKAERVEAGRVVLAGGEEVPFEVLLAVPPHRCPRVLVEAGLAEPDGWVKVDPRTLETPFDGVWAVGDCTGIVTATGQPLPKAGALAESAGIVAAGRVAARLSGAEPQALFEGLGACFLEVGGGEAMVVRGRFLAEPAPEVELTEASPANLEEKARFERERLEAWFGAA
jgi:sulfide:quinone oxidoreductase